MIHRVGLLCTLAGTLLVAGCGSGSKTVVQTVTAPAASTQRTEATTTPTTEGGSSSNNDVRNAAAAVGMTRAAVEVARYCLRTIGARIGKAPPPDAALVHKRDYFVLLALRGLKNYPGEEINGESLREYLAGEAEKVKNCDSRLSAEIKAALLANSGAALQKEIDRVNRADPEAGNEAIKEAEKEEE
jgi:hypothetical protein